MYAIIEKLRKARKMLLHPTKTYRRITMEIFYLTLSQMLMMFTLILLGFILRKAHILPDNANTTMAKLETYIFVPALTLSGMLQRCTVSSFIANWKLMLYGGVIIFAALLLAYPLGRLFVRKADTPDKVYQRNIYTYAMTFGNYGFMGNFIVKGVWGNDVFFKYLLFQFVIGIVVHSWGLYVLIPKEKGLAGLKKGLINPPMIALVVGIIAGLLNVNQYMPTFATNVLDKAGACMGPVAMVLAGFVIGGYNLREILLNKKVYIASAMRLIVLPALLMLVLKALGTPEDIMTLALIAFATPFGLNTIVYPAAYGGDPKTGASMTTISSTLAVITIPLMYLVFIVLL